MGFMDKLKGMKNMVTGGAAKVYLEAPDAQLIDPFTVTIRANIDDAELEIDGVYLIIRAEEEVRIEASSVRDRIREAVEGWNDDGILDTITEEEETFEQRFQVAGPQTLAANDACEWTIEVDLPDGAMPTFRGRNCQHTWRFFAGLDARGNDPDSGWVEIPVR